MASPTPVFPEVGSPMGPPGPTARAPPAPPPLPGAIRSLTEPPGLKYSTLARTAGAWPPPTDDVTARSLTSGVFPTSSVRDSWTCIATTSFVEALGPRPGPGHAPEHRRYPTFAAVPWLTSTTVADWSTRGLWMRRP